MKKKKYQVISTILALSLLAGTTFSGGKEVRAQNDTADLHRVTMDADGREKQPVATPTAAIEGSTAVEETAAPTETPVTTPTLTPDVSPSPQPVDVTQIKISKSKAVIMAGKTVTPVITGTNSPIVWTSDNEAAATVDETGVIKGVKKGKATITASMDGVTRVCYVTVVGKVSQKDFSKFNSENFIHFCRRYHYDSGFAWNGQWKGGSKKKKTYRGITIGSSKSKIHSAYGELKWKKCTSKDPFVKMKGLKKNKVKTYADVTYGKDRIRFYVNKKNKVVAIIFACNINKIKKTHLRRYL